MTRKEMERAVANYMHKTYKKSSHRRRIENEILKEKVINHLDLFESVYADLRKMDIKMVRGMIGVGRS